MRRWLVATGLALLASPLHAEVTPQAGAGDPHIQQVAYDPQQVVGLHVALGYAVTVELAPDERVETVTLGDANGWAVQVNHRADHLVVKPQAAAPPTNLTVITDQRTYNFSLYGAGRGEGVQPYLLSFTYPQPAPLAAPAPAVGHYRLQGDRALWPSRLEDDGRFTRLVWPAAVEMPAVYAEGADGRQALVNGVMREGAYVIEGVAPRLLFLRGGHRASALRQAEPAP